MLFVSCQPYKDESYYTKDFILNMAFAAKMGGAKGLRIEGVENILYIKKEIDLSIIGIIKNKIEGKERYISPNIESIDKIIRTNCEFIAIDYTLRDKCDKNYYIKISKHVHEQSDCKIVADVSTIKEAKLSIDCGADFVSTTLCGYTYDTKDKKLPALDLIRHISNVGIKNLIAEGGYSKHSQYVKALEWGAKIVVIGTAITRPHLIVKKIIHGHY